MAFNDNSHQKARNHHATNMSPVVMRTESGDKIVSSSMVIPMTPVSRSSVFSTRSPKEKLSVDPSSAYLHTRPRTSTFATEVSVDVIKDRLRIRESLYRRLNAISNVMCFLGISGIILMIAENELTFKYIDNHDTTASWFIKLIITITTAILIILIFYYHYLDLKHYAFRNLHAYFYIALTPSRILLIIIEVLICIIHPVPRSYPQSDSEMLNSNFTISTSSTTHPITYTATDVGLGLPMFLRFYLFARVVNFHSRMFRSATIRSFGYINQVSIDFFVLLKTYVEQMPTRVLFIVCTLTFFIGSWSLRACSYTDDGHHMSISDAMWVFVITFTSVGYGDIYPKTYCGRSIASIIGIIGVFINGFLVAVLALKLILTREEKLVNKFVSNLGLSKEHKKQGANVVKFAIKVWYLKRKNKTQFFNFLEAQRKLFRSIRNFQQIRRMQRNLNDDTVGFNELMTIHQSTNVRTEDTVEQIVEIKTEMKKVQEELKNMKYYMEDLKNTIHFFFEQNHKMKL